MHIIWEKIPLNKNLDREQAGYRFIETRANSKKGEFFMRPLDRVIGYEPIKEELYMIIDSFKNPQKYKALGATPMRGIVFSGDPGIGKTLMAEALIEEVGWESFVIRRNRTEEKFIDHIMTSFDEARQNAPSIILLEDADKYKQSMFSEEEYTTIQSCIDECKEDVFVILTANSLNNMPDSLLREGRFDKQFHMKFPTGDDAAKIFEKYLATKKVASDIDTYEIARCLQGYSCATLENLVNEASIVAAYRSSKLLEQCDLRKACMRLFFGTPETIEISDENRKRVAAHEAGHALAAELLMPESVNYVSIDSKSRNKLGLTSIYADMQNGHDFEWYENITRYELAGKAASEIVLGEIDTGVAEDMREVYDNVRIIIDDFAAYEFGNWVHGDETSQGVYENKDIATKTIIAKYYAETKKLLIKNRKILDAIIDAVMEKGTLFYRDIQELIHLKQGGETNYE